MKYGWQEIESIGYSSKRISIIGNLHKTGRKVKPVRCSVRQIYKDDNSQLWVKIRGLFWRFPEEIDY